jgi:hypothetical protein
VRMLLKISIPVQRGNEAIREGTFPTTMEGLFDRIRPEASYFTLEDGRRTGYLVFDMQDSQDMPPTLEPLFIHLDAAVELSPCMNREELGVGIAEAAKSF